MRARRREERFLHIKRLFENAVTFCSEATIAGKFGRGDCGANVLDLLASGERAVEWNADHDAVNDFLPINKSNPPGKETPFHMTLRPICKCSPNFVKPGRTSNSRPGSNSNRAFFAHATKS